MTTPADELRAAADRLAPEPETPPTLTGEHPDLDACYAELLRSTARTVEAVLRHRPDAIDETAHWLAPALAVARQLLTRTSERILGTRYAGQVRAAVIERALCRMAAADERAARETLRVDGRSA
jgi:hypothetical protein